MGTETVDTVKALGEAEVAELLQVNVRTLRELVRRGRVPAADIANTERTRRWRPSTILSFLRGETQPQPQTA
jgi:hypothetical protein